MGTQEDCAFTHAEILGLKLLFALMDQVRAWAVADAVLTSIAGCHGAWVDTLGTPQQLALSLDVSLRSVAVVPPCWYLVCRVDEPH